MAKELCKSEWDCLIEGETLKAVMCWVDVNEENPYMICTRCFKEVVGFNRGARETLRRTGLD